MSQPTIIMPGRVSEIRYAHNPATFVFDWGQRPVPGDLSITALIGGGRQVTTAFIPTRQVVAGLLLLTLSVEQMNQLLIAPGTNPLTLELHWGGMVQVILEVKATLTANTSPVKPAVIGLPDSVNYQIESDLSAELAVQGAANALSSANAALSSQHAAYASETNAQESAEVAISASASAQDHAQTATEAADTAVNAVGNIMTFNGYTQYGALLGFGGNIQYTENNDRYKTVTIEFL